MTRMHTFWSFVSWKCTPSESQRVRQSTKLHWNSPSFETIARKTHVKCVLKEVATNAQKTQQTQQARINANGMHYACSLHALHCALCSAQCTLCCLLIL